MPELPEVETQARQLNAVIGQRRIERVTELCPRILDRPAAELQETLSDSLISRVWRRAKYVVFDLDSGEKLITHLRMTGKYSLGEEGEERRRHDRVIFTLDDQRLLVFHDLRRFGVIALFDRTAWETLDRRLGVEPLSDSLTAAHCAELMAGRHCSIKTALLNQNLIAGVGNIYAAEALFRAKIHPATEAGRLSKPDCSRLTRHLRQLLREAIAQNGATISDFSPIDSKTGDFQRFLRVYGKAGKPCPRCRTAIERMKQQQRSTFFCPRCQPLG